MRRKWLTVVLVLLALGLVACESAPEKSLMASYTPQAAPGEATQTYLNGSLIPGRDVYEGVPVSIQVTSNGFVQISFQDGVLLYFWVGNFQAISGLPLGQRSRFVLKDYSRFRQRLDRWEKPLPAPEPRPPRLFEGF